VVHRFVGVSRGVGAGVDSRRHPRASTASSASAGVSGPESIRGATNLDHRLRMPPHIDEPEILQQSVSGVRGKADQPEPDALSLADVGRPVGPGVWHGPQWGWVPEGIQLRRRRRIGGSRQTERRDPGITGAEADAGLLGDDEPLTVAAQWSRAIARRDGTSDAAAGISDGTEPAEAPALRHRVGEPERHLGLPTDVFDSGGADPVEH